MGKNIYKKISRILLLLYIIICIISIAGCKEDAIPSKIIDKDEIIKAYTDNSERFKIVAEYIQNDKHDIFIEKLKDNEVSIEMAVGNRVNNTEIGDKKVKDEVEFILKKLKFKYIKERGGNSIYFTRQTSLSFGQGIAYSKDNNKPDWGRIEELEHISGNWYYFREY